MSKTEIISVTALTALVATIAGAWLTHVGWWVNLLITDQMDTIGEGVLAIIGTIIAPVGIIHGFLLWF